MFAISIPRVVWPHSIEAWDFGCATPRAGVNAGRACSLPWGRSFWLASFCLSLAVSACPEFLELSLSATVCPRLCLSVFVCFCPRLYADVYPELRPELHAHLCVSLSRPVSLCLRLSMSVLHFCRCVWLFVFVCICQLLSVPRSLCLSLPVSLCVTVGLDLTLSIFVSLVACQCLLLPLLHGCCLLVCVQTRQRFYRSLAPTRFRSFGEDRRQQQPLSTI